MGTIWGLAERATGVTLFPSQDGAVKKCWRPRFRLALCWQSSGDSRFRGGGQERWPRGLAGPASGGPESGISYPGALRGGTRPPAGVNLGSSVPSTSKEKEACQNRLSRDLSHLWKVVKQLQELSTARPLNSLSWWRPLNMLCCYLRWKLLTPQDFQTFKALNVIIQTFGFCLLLMWRCGVRVGPVAFHVTGRKKTLVHHCDNSGQLRNFYKCKMGMIIELVGLL